MSGFRRPRVHPMAVLKRTEETTTAFLRPILLDQDIQQRASAEQLFRQDRPDPDTSSLVIPTSAPGKARAYNFLSTKYTRSKITPIPDESTTQSTAAQEVLSIAARSESGSQNSWWSLFSKNRSMQPETVQAQTRSVEALLLSPRILRLKVDDHCRYGGIASGMRINKSSRG